MSIFEKTAARLRAAMAGLRESTESHPRRIAVGVGSGLLLFSATAFGLAEYGPQPKLPPATILDIPVAMNVAPQVQALDDVAQVAYTTAQVRRSDTAVSLLHRLEVTDPAQLRALARNAQMRALLAAPGHVVTARVNTLGELVRLEARLPQGSGQRRPAAAPWRLLTLEAQPDGRFVGTVTQEDAQAQVRMATGVVRSTLYAAADEAGMPDAVAVQLIRLFSGEVDFRRTVRPGDRFTVVWRQYMAQGQTVRMGRILSAQITSGGVTHSAVWFDPKDHQPAAGYYHPDGSSLARAFLLSPLPYDRLTSGYGWRISPIFHKPEFHKGIDLAIPVGTPVRTIADGRVVYAGWGTGYGKYVKVVHPNGFATIYSHLSAFRVHVGEHVKQGDVVALSGNTGWSTGPHLYFQFFVNGTPVNPLTISHYSPKGTPVPAALRDAFFAQTAEPERLLALAPGAAVASAKAASPQASAQKG